MRPHFAKLGITRLARQTGLDRLGIPCFAAIRPNSCSIATNQGKGLDDDQAAASAVMEAVEYAIAEAPMVETATCSLEAVHGLGRTVFLPKRLMPMGEEIAPTLAIKWVEGWVATDASRRALIPLDAVAMNGDRRDLAGIAQSTNGLASGNNREEAIFHGTCELIERDAATLWSLLPIEAKQARCIAPESFGSDAVMRLVQRFERAGLRVRLFEQTSDIAVPTILAVSGPPAADFSVCFDIATGAGTHTDPARAAIRALTEAAQTRVTSIAGARDDFSPNRYRLDGAEEAFALLEASPQRRSLDREAAQGLDAMTVGLFDALAAAGVNDLIAVPLGGEAFGASVVRMLSTMLEDRGPNPNWRPGPRTLAALGVAL
jgi:YcaO-like protein with predicted kinase domain